MLRFFADLAGKYTKTIIIVWLVLSLPVIWGVTRIEARTSQRDLVPTRYESSRTLQHMDELFGKIENSDIVLEGVDMTSFPMVKKLMLIEEELRAEVGEGRIQSVNSYLGDFVKGVEKETGFQSIGSLFRLYNENMQVPDPSNPDRTLPFKDVLVQGVDTMLADPVNQLMIIDKGGLLSRDEQAARVMVILTPETASGQHADSARKIEEFAKTYFSDDPDLAGLQVRVAGDPSLEKDLEHYIKGNTLFLILIAMLFMILILYFTFRRLSDVFLCLMVIFLSVMWIFGLMGWFKIPFTLISVALGPLILGINIADVVYMMSRFYEEMHEGRVVKEAARRAILTVGVAVFLAAVSTIFGFASFAFSDLTTIQQFGLMACLGEAVGFLLSVTLLPAVMIWREERREKKEGQYWAQRKRIFARGRSTRLDAILRRAAGVSNAHPVIILSCTGVIIIVCFLGAMRLETTSDLRNLIPQNLPAIQAQHEEERLFGGQQTDFVLVSGDLFTPQAMQAMYDFEQNLGSREYFFPEGITTLEDIMAAALAGTQGVDLLSLKTPEEVRAAYESVKGFIPREVLTEDGRTTLISINSYAAPNSDIVTAKRQTLQDVVSDDLGKSGLGHEVGGMTPLTADLVGNLVPTQILTSIFALVLSGLVLMLIFRSFFMGLATLSVLLVSISVEIGFLAIILWPLDMMTVLVTSMIIGVGIDFGIHVTWRFREEYGHREESARQALEITATSVGRPIVAAALSTAAAFFILTFTRIMPVRRFGGVTAIALVVGLAATLLVLPAMLTLITRYNKKFIKVEEPADTRVDAES
jgi:predicted RND superfamily exporter protein